MKRIITFSDGTWNDPGEEDGGVPAPTNVCKISNMIAAADAAGNAQVHQYFEGVGVAGNFFQKLDGGVTGAGLDQEIMDAYKFIVSNYEPGDLNYLFGFSRGAYTARSLAGFIVNCGILKPENVGMIQQAYNLYRGRDADSTPWSAEAQQFRDNYSYPPAVYFIGVWDTVGALGIPIGIFESIDAAKYQFHDVQLSSQVPYAYHAMAVDEHRKIFDVTLWHRSDTAIANNVQQTIEQVWFAGAHRNVGGGYADVGLSDNTLQWMVEKAQGAGLVFNEPPGTYKIDPVNGVLVNSLDFGYDVLQGFKTFYRVIDLQNQDFNPEAVSQSVYDRINGGVGYNPPNVPPNA